MQHDRALIFALPAILATMMAPDQARAGGFYIPQQSVLNVGRAFVGGSVMAEDASTIFANPAGMTQLSGPQITTGASLLVLYLDFDKGGGNSATTGPFSAPVTGNSGGDPIDPQVVPNIYIATPVYGQDLWLGLGITAPFGISNDYRNGWFGRYDSINSELTTINVGPSVAYRINPMLSIGAGLDIQYARAKLTSALPNPVFFGAPDPSTDGFSRLKGDDWAYGFNAGLLFEPAKGTRVGLHYRSQMDYNIQGDADVTLPTNLGGTKSTQGAHTELDLPQIVTFGVAQDITPQLTISSELSWFGWSSFDELRIKSDEGAPNEERKQGYQNSITVGIAAEYQWTEALKTRIGFQFDQTPTRKQYRNTSVPDANRYWGALGVSYDVDSNLSIDASYALTIFEQADVDTSRTFYSGTGLDTTVNTEGRATNRGDTFALNLRYRF